MAPCGPGQRAPLPFRISLLLLPLDTDVPLLPVLGPEDPKVGMGVPASSSLLTVARYVARAS